MENKNSYKAFQENLLNTISKELNRHGRYECKLTQNVKNNVVLKGICIHKADETVASVFYLENCYQDYLEGKSLHQICRDIIALYKEMDIPVFNENSIANYAKIKEKLRVRLVSRERNERFYKQGPYRLETLGAEVLYIELEHSQEGSAFVRVTHDIAEKWGIPKLELFQTALENTQNNHKASFLPMEDVIKGLSRDEKTETAEEPFMYVLTNEQQEYGATVTSYPGVLREIREQLGKDFYILPSSTHEVIILPKKLGMNAKELRSMVREINQNEVAPEEILGNEVYEFRGATNKVHKCVKEEKQR